MDKVYILVAENDAAFWIVKKFFRTENLARLYAESQNFLDYHVVKLDE